MPLFLSMARLDDDAVDPPTRLLQKLADLNLELKPASAGEPRGDYGVFERVGGKRGQLYWVAIKRRFSDTKVLLDLGYWYGSLAAKGEEVVFELKDGHWVLTEHGMMWRS